jgi:alkylhydroperoxidase family enzyme
MGIGEEKVRNLHNYEGNDLFSPTEQLVLKYMEQLTLERRTDPEIEAQLKQHFDDRERVELALIGGLWNMTNRLFNSLGLELEPFVEATHRELMKSTFAR